MANPWKSFGKNENFWKYVCCRIFVLEQGNSSLSQSVTVYPALPRQPAGDLLATVRMMMMRIVIVMTIIMMSFTKKKQPVTFWPRWGCWWWMVTSGMLKMGMRIIIIWKHVKMRFHPGSKMEKRANSANLLVLQGVPKKVPDRNQRRQRGQITNCF